MMADEKPIDHFTVARDTPEWDRMWSAILDKDYVSPSGERWEYMGTVLLEGGPWVHQFRHRQHPNGDGRRHYIDVPLSQEFVEQELPQILREERLGTGRLLHRMRLAYHLSQLALARSNTKKPVTARRLAELEWACKVATEKSPLYLLTVPESAHGRVYLSAEEVGQLLGVSRFRIRQFRLEGLLPAEQENQRVFKYDPGPAWELYLQRKAKGPDLHKGGRPKKDAQTTIRRTVMSHPKDIASPTLHAVLSRYITACEEWTPLKSTDPAMLQGEALEQMRTVYQHHREATQALRVAIHAECQAGRFVVGTLKSGEQVTIGTLGPLVSEDEQFYSEKQNAELAFRNFRLRELVELEAVETIS